MRFKIFIHLFVILHPASQFVMSSPCQSVPISDVMDILYFHQLHIEHPGLCPQIFLPECTSWEQLCCYANAVPNVALRYNLVSWWQQSMERLIWKSRVGTKEQWFDLVEAVSALEELEVLLKDPEVQASDERLNLTYGRSVHRFLGITWENQDGELPLKYFHPATERYRPRILTSKNTSMYRFVDVEQPVSRKRKAIESIVHKPERETI